MWVISVAFLSLFRRNRIFTFHPVGKQFLLIRGWHLLIIFGAGASSDSCGMWGVAKFISLVTLSCQLVHKVVDDVGVVIILTLASWLSLCIICSAIIWPLVLLPWWISRRISGPRHGKVCVVSFSWLRISADLGFLLEKLGHFASPFGLEWHRFQLFSPVFRH